MGKQRHLSIGFFVAVCLLVLALSTPANGDVVYSTFGSGQSHLAFGYAVGTPSGGQPEENATPFMPSSNYTLDLINFAAYYISGLNHLTVNLAADVSGVPGTILESWSVDIDGSPAIYTVTSSVHPLLGDSNKYWVWLTANDLTNSDLAWNLNDQGHTGEFAFRIGYQPNWITVTDSLPAFDVTGTPVPEPSTILLLVSGLIGLAVYGRKKFSIK